MFWKGQDFGLPSLVVSSASCSSFVTPSNIGLIINHTCSDILYGAVFFPIFNTFRKETGRKKRRSIFLLKDYKSSSHFPSFSIDKSWDTWPQRRLANVVSRQVAICLGKIQKVGGEIPFLQEDSFCQSPKQGLYITVLDFRWIFCLQLRSWQGEERLQSP